MTQVTALKDTNDRLLNQLQDFQRNNTMLSDSFSEKGQLQG
jgi:hypothetical protein